MSVNVILQALETEGVVKIVSSPKVVTQNNKKAKVLSGQKIPYPAQQAGVTTGAITVSFADANLSLEVTPQITNDGTILMDIHVEKADADFAQEVAGTPTITQKLIETQVLVKDGGTAIMGGVYKNTNSTQLTGVPFLSKLPLIGFLFRNKTDQRQQRRAPGLHHPAHPQELVSLVRPWSRPSRLPGGFGFRVLAPTHWRVIRLAPPRFAAGGPSGHAGPSPRAESIRLRFIEQASKQPSRDAGHSRDRSPRPHAANRRNPHPRRGRTA